MLSAYRTLAAEREAQGVPALALTAEQTQGLTELLQSPPAGEDETLLHLLSERIPPGVDEAAYVKATWLSAVAQGEASSPLVSPLEATRLLGTMVGGYNVAALIELLQHSDEERPVHTSLRSMRGGKGTGEERRRSCAVREEHLKRSFFHHRTPIQRLSLPPLPVGVVGLHLVWG